jgi:DNA-cytosine methyltransferase
MKKLNVLSCFDGMSCGQESLKQLEIPVGKYYSSELDKYAMAVTQHNHPDTIQVGDITNWRDWDIDWSEIDLIFGGSPCQGFSFAGKQLAFDDPRSKLFFVFVEIINHIKKVNPNVKFLLENVRMKQEYLDIISEYIGVQPVKINSALVSAQNRVRYYWTNIAELEQPEDRGILLKDILETGDTVIDAIYNNRDPRVYKQKAPTIRAGRQGLDTVKGGAMRGRYLVNGKRADHTVDSMAGKTEQRIETRTDGKMNCLTSVSKDSLVVTREGGNLEPKVMVEHSIIRDKSKCVRTSGRGSYDRHEWDSVDKLHWRKLTPLECERLQTVPDNYTLVPWQKRMMSNSQRYKMLGNGWTIEVIKYIFNNLQTSPV